MIRVARSSFQSSLRKDLCPVAQGPTPFYGDIRKDWCPAKMRMRMILVTLGNQQPGNFGKPTTGQLWETMIMMLPSCFLFSLVGVRAPRALLLSSFLSSALSLPQFAIFPSFRVEDSGTAG